MFNGLGEIMVVGLAAIVICLLAAFLLSGWALLYIVRSLLNI